MNDPSAWRGLPLPDTDDIPIEARVRRHAQRKPDAMAVITPAGSLTWAQLDEAVDRLAGAFAARGLRPGDRVAWLGRNRVESVVVLLATRRRRLVFVGLNWRLLPAEMAGVIANADPALIVADPEFLTLVPAGSACISSLPHEGLTSVADLIRDHAPVESLPAQQDDVATLFYTSGTSGAPKGVVYHLANAEAAVFAATPLEFSPDSILLIVAPVFHLAGSVWSQYGLAGGMPQVLLPMAAPADMLAAVERWKVTHAQWVPTMLSAALQQQRETPADLSTLRIIPYGVSPIAPALLAQSQAVLGCEFVQVYGLTETVGPVTHLPAAAHHGSWREATGFPNPGVEIRIVDPDGVDLPAGQSGEVLLRTPWARPQYWRLPEGAKESFDGEDWLHTGDAGHLDADGCLHVTDRLTEMIITGGENVYPVEVENVLMGLPGVRDAAVFGVPDERWGQAIWAAIVPADDRAQDGEALVAACRERLSHYKCPRRIVITGPLARNATGKLMRKEIRDACQAAIV